MANRIIRWVVLLALIGVGLLLYAPGWQQALNGWGLIPDQYQFGDLYNMTYLRRFRETDFLRDKVVPLSERPARRYPNVDVLVIGDSFTGLGIDTSLYAGHRNLHRWISGTPTPTIRLDSTRRTVLFLEIVERILFERLADGGDLFINEGFRIDTARTAALPGTPEPVAEGPRPSLWTRIEARIPNLEWFSAGDINQRLEFLVFNFAPFRWFKEIKAELHYRAFGRILAEAAVSPGGRYIFYGFESNPRRGEASTYPASDALIDSTVASLNQIRQHYRRMGVAEVYLSLVPNKFSSLEPDVPGLNHRIDRIERHPNLELPHFNSTRFLLRRPDLYHLGDGHWNRHAKRIWLDSVNTIVGREATRNRISAP